MSVAPYPEYKDSGVEWVGEIPAHWQFIPLKRAIGFTTGWTPPTGREDLYEGDNAWATIGDMSGRLIKETAKTISDEAIRLAAIRACPKTS
jgi:type I restriction enzyme S subunit